MYVVILIGGIASGKSEAGDYLAQKGAHVIDLDRVSRDVVTAQSPLLDKLACTFGDDIIDEDGLLDRSRLAFYAFSSDEQTQKLNEIMHPAIFERVSAYLVGGTCSVTRPDLVVIQSPLLVALDYLAGLYQEVLLIDTPIEIRRRRAIERGMSVKDFDARVAQQSSDYELREAATTVIKNSGTIENLKQALDGWLEGRAQGLF